MLPIFNCVYAAEDADDARPGYMKNSYCTGTIDGKSAEFYGFVAAVIPTIGVSAIDLAAQKEELKRYKRVGIDSSIDYYSNLNVFSEKSATNPTVVLWLHGSKIENFNSDSARPFLDKGLALATFDRFHVYDTESKSRLSLINGTRFDATNVSLPTTSWNQQDSLALSTEVIMVHKMCKRLKEEGTSRIILAGHSRGGILVNECAKENVAELFQSAGVVGYVAIGALPLMMEPITKTIPVVWIGGVHDTICPPDLMQFYHEKYLDRQQNIRFHQIANMGHRISGSGEVTVLGSIREFFKRIRKHRSEPFMWPEITLNSLKMLAFCLFGTRGFTYRTRNGAQSFINACSAVDEHEFRPLVRRKSELALGGGLSMDSYPRFIKDNMSIGVRSKEPIKTKTESAAITSRIVDYIFGIVS